MGRLLCHFIRVILVVALIPAADSQAAEKTKPLRVSMWGEYMPLHGFIGNRAVGLEAELAYMLGAYFKRDVIFVDSRKKGMSSIEAVARGEADIAINAITPTAEREKLVAFTKPYLSMPYRIAYRCGNTTHPRCPDLASKKIAAPEGPAFSVLQEIAGAEAISAPSLQSAVDLLNAKKVDFIFGEQAGLVVLNRDRRAWLCITGCPLGVTHYAIAVPKAEVQMYNEALAALHPAISEVARWWAPNSSTGDADLLTEADLAWADRDEMKRLKESFKQSFARLGLDQPSTRSVPGDHGHSSRKARDAGGAPGWTLKRAQSAWISAWPLVMHVGRVPGGNRYEHILYGSDASDLLIRTGPSLCRNDRRSGVAREDAGEGDDTGDVLCRAAKGQEWTAHTRTGLVRATVHSVRAEVVEECNEQSARMMAHFAVDTPEDVLFISSLPLRSGKSEYLAAEKQAILPEDIPADVRKYFQDNVFAGTGEHWDAFRVPGSPGEAIALVKYEATGDRETGPDRYAVLRWAANGGIQVVYRTVADPPNRYYYCGHPILQVEGFFDFDGDGDLDILIKNGNLGADALSFLLRVEGGYRPFVFTEIPPCSC